MKPPRVIIFGIDGGSFDLIDPLIAAGELPHLSRFLAGAVSARTTTTWPAHTAPGWASFATSCHPGRHGLFQFFATQEPNYGARIVGSSDLHRSTMWDWLAAQGWRMGLVNIPMSHPPRGHPGYEITWPLANTLRYTSPSSLLGELTQHGAPFRSDLATMYRGDLGYIREALRNVEARLRSVEYLVENHSVDAMMVVLTEVDRVCHHYWHFSDPDHPQHRAGAGGELHDAIVAIYRAVDTAFGAIQRWVKDDGTVVLVSDHGFGAGRHAFAVHRLLEDARLLATRPVGGGPSSVASWFQGAAREVDWERTRVYMPVPGSYALNVNLRGRQASGVVRESEREATLAEVQALLDAVRVPGTDRRAFATLASHEAFPGEATAEAPDLLLLPLDESVMVTPSLDEEVWSASAQTGLHRHEGLWAQSSPRVRAGRLAGRVRLIDTVPTLLCDAGAAFPDNIDGRVVDEAFLVLPERHVLRHAEPRCALPPRPAGGEDAETAARLRQMGYL